MTNPFLKALSDAIDKDLEKYFDGVHEYGETYEHKGTLVTLEVNGVSTKIELTPDFFNDLYCAVSNELEEVNKLNSPK